MGYGRPGGCARDDFVEAVEGRHEARLCYRVGRLTLVQTSVPLDRLERAPYPTRSEALWLFRAYGSRGAGPAAAYGSDFQHVGVDEAAGAPLHAGPRVLLALPGSALARPGPGAPGTVRLVGAADRLVNDHLRRLALMLPLASQGDLRLISEATIALMGSVLNDTLLTDRPRSDLSGSTRRAEVDRVIRANIGSARLDAARISALAGISRSSLYRLMDETGGVAAYVRALRLRMIYDDLRDPALADISICDLAQRRGLHCASSFARSFRQTFGVTPSMVRAEALSAGRERHRDADGDAGPPTPRGPA